MANNIKLIFVIGIIILPILGYVLMRILIRTSKIMIENKVIDKGMYKEKPLRGEEVLPVAKSFERIGIYVFVFTALGSIIFSLILFKNW